jgi:hypothetical protein
MRVIVLKASVRALTSLYYSGAFEGNLLQNCLHFLDEVQDQFAPLITDSDHQPPAGSRGRQ